MIMKCARTQDLMKLLLMAATITSSATAFIHGGIIKRPLSHLHPFHTSAALCGSRTPIKQHLPLNEKKTDDDDVGESSKPSQNELLLELESKFDYDGRISSKVLSNDDLIDDSLDSLDNQQHRCALVTILGLPNMGKSTLLNALLDDNLAIATSRPQTTRHAILGVMTTDFSQICLTDTPGIIGNPAYQLQEGMMGAVNGAVRGCDVFLVVTDVYSGGKMDNDGDDDDDYGIGEDMLARLQQSHRPVIVVVNKVDLVADGDESVYTNTPVKAIQTIQKWRSVLPDAFAIIPTCAANGSDDAGVVALRSLLLANDPDVDVGAAIRNLGRPVNGMFPADTKGMPTKEETTSILPLGPPLYHADFFTDRTDRFCASELIRETLFENFKKEMPYCCEVRIETFDESKRYIDEDNDSDGKKKSKSMIRIGAVILVERDSQKGIVVGKGGQKIKDVGMDARKKLETFFGCKIFLDLRVKVDKNWRSNKDRLTQFGYMT